MSHDPLTIEHTVNIEAPVDLVWKFLTDPNHVPRWLGCLLYQKKEGHVFYMQQDQDKREAGDTTDATHCRILTLDKPSRFSFSWYLPATPETTVSIDLKSSGDSTSVTLTHSGWDQFELSAIENIREALDDGWKAFVLPGLKGAVEAAD